MTNGADRSARGRMVALDEELEATHPGWMTGTNEAEKIVATQEEPMIEKMTRAIADAAAKAVDQNIREPYYEYLARAALRAMLEGLAPVSDMLDSTRPGERVFLYDLTPLRKKAGL